MLKNYLDNISNNNISTYVSRDREDIIIEFLINNFEIEKTCIEVGASDGISQSNTLNIRNNYGFTSLLIEPPGDSYDKLIKLANEKTHIECCYINHKGTNTIDSISSKFFNKIGVLSLDIDGNELEIFENMAVRPQIVVIEYNNQFPPHIDYQDPPNCKYFRHSAKAISRIGHNKNYTTIYVTNDNVILLDNELKNDKFEDLFIEKPIEILSNYYNLENKKYLGLILTCKQYTNRHIFIFKPNILLRIYAKILDLFAFIRSLKKRKFYLKYDLNENLKINIKNSKLYF